MTMTEHLDAETIYELAEGRLEPGRERAAEAHLWRCDSCRALREECASTLEALRWYGDRDVTPPEGYWSDFWARWPLAGDVRSAAGRSRRLLPAAAAAAVLVLAVGTWWAADRRGESSLDPVASSASASFAPGPRPDARELVAGTAWESDFELLERVTFAIGSVDPTSKGVALASLAEEP